MAKRVGIITFLHNDNYGSSMQAYALQRIVQSLGYQAEHLDYNPSVKEKIRNLLTSGNSPKLVLEGLRKKQVKAEQQGAAKKSAGFPVFYKKHMKLSDPCSDEETLKRRASVEDILLCGSDQIWSPVWLNPVFFLNFAERRCPKVAYAPSLGVSKLPDKRKQLRMAHMISSFRSVSVREEEGAALIEKMTGYRPPVMPDPVLLLEKQDWQALAESPGWKQPVLLCYFIGSNPEYWEEAERISHEMGWQIAVMPVTGEAYSKPYPTMDGCTPEQWLGCLNEAACILTDSFHGLAFSALLHRPYKVLRRYKADDPESKNSRVDQLLRTLQLPEDTVKTPYDSTEALHAVRYKGISWLSEALAEASAPRGTAKPHAIAHL